MDQCCNELEIYLPISRDFSDDDLRQKNKYNHSNIVISNSETLEYFNDEAHASNSNPFLSLFQPENLIEEEKKVLVFANSNEDSGLAETCGLYGFDSLKFRNDEFVDVESYLDAGNPLMKVNYYTNYLVASSLIVNMSYA